MRNTRISEAETRAAIALDGLAGALAAFTAQKLSGADGIGGPDPGFAFAPAKTMHDAAILASQRCGSWRLEGEEDIVDSREGLLYLADLQDSRLRPSLSDSGSFYLVAEDGAIGLTTDGCKNIEWIFLAEKGTWEIVNTTGNAGETAETAYSVEATETAYSEETVGDIAEGPEGETEAIDVIDVIGVMDV
ncbi:MAG: hypothetical protein K6B72_01330 [Lachnospiraceae bacterium]|nr:hypothetical protein [Lachnospiraceae bacterium]